ncbi:MAG: hypothetical protein IJY04_00145, partial [Clostridia bacterium]|nr:hypothetical protein [Clostridia bacterium]
MEETHMTGTRNKLKIVGLLLTAVIAVILLGILSLPASAATAADITVTIDTGASVTLRDKDADGFYELSTEQDLIAFRTAVNGGRNTINVELMNNVDVSANSNWTPIGTISTPYSGYFDGKGYKVSGIAVSGTYGPQQEKGEGNIGFFGNIQNAGIRNLTVYGEITASVSNIASVSYPLGSGLLVGVMQDSILDGCLAEAYIDDSGISTGALVGTALHSIIINCGSTGTVTSSSNYTGGLVGYMTVGYDRPMCLLNSYSVVSITKEGGGGYVGGRVGYLAD